MQRELLLGCSGWYDRVWLRLGGFARPEASAPAPAPQDLTVKSLRIVDAEGRTRIKLDCAGE